MKKIIPFLFFAGLLFTACDPMDDIYDKIDEQEITNVKEDIEVIFSEENYVAMGGDVADNLYFSETDPAENYIPSFLTASYPNLTEGSAVKITYNYLKSGLEYLDYLTGSTSYELTADDYDSMGEESGQPGKYDNFDSSAPPENYLPALFASKYPDAEAGDLVFVTYKFYSGGTNNISEYYEFDGSSWAAVEVELPEGVSVYELTTDDYDSMGENSGQPGKYDNFDSSMPPGNYLPTFLSLKFPYSQEGAIAAVVYKYYASGSTDKMASEYTKTTSGWASVSVTAKTDQYVYSSSGWVFDPTVNYTMLSEDYQLIVDYVNTSIGADYVDSFGTAEDYFGVSAFYSEFRINDGYFEASQFATWQDAVKEAIGNVFLPAKYPNAQVQVDGVDIYYVVTFAGYAGSMVDYTIKFQCTTSGPNPEFTYVEGPTEK